VKKVVPYGCCGVVRKVPDRQTGDERRRGGAKRAWRAAECTHVMLEDMLAACRGRGGRRDLRLTLRLSRRRTTMSLTSSSSSSSGLYCVGRCMDRWEHVRVCQERPRRPIFQQ